VLSRNLEKSLHRALACANERRHEYATLEHLLLSLTEDQDAVAVLRACGVELERLRREVLNYVVTSSPTLLPPTATMPSQRRASNAYAARRDPRSIFSREEVTGRHVLVAMFAERESHAVYFLQEQDMTRFDAGQLHFHGSAKAPDVRKLGGSKEPRRTSAAKSRRSAIMMP